MTCKTPENRPAKIGEGVSFERIRRITGYLVGPMDKWTHGVRTGERDRVKDGV